MLLISVLWHFIEANDQVMSFFVVLHYSITCFSTNSSSHFAVGWPSAKSPPETKSFWLTRMEESRPILPSLLQSIGLNLGLWNRHLGHGTSRSRPVPDEVQKIHIDHVSLLYPPLEAGQSSS